MRTGWCSIRTFSNPCKDWDFTMEKEQNTCNKSWKLGLHHEDGDEKSGFQSWEQHQEKLLRVEKLTNRGRVQMSREEMRKAEITWEQTGTRSTEKSWDELRGGEKPWDEMGWGEVKKVEKTRYEMRWDEMRWCNGIGQDGVRWDEIEQGEIWDGMRLNKIRWDEVRRADMRWDQVIRRDEQWTEMSQEWHV